MELANRSQTGRCGGCGGRLVASGDKAHGRIVVCQICGKCPDARAPLPNEKSRKDDYTGDREIAREKDRAYRRKRNAAAKAAH